MYVILLHTIEVSQVRGDDNLTKVERHATIKTLSVNLDIGGAGWSTVIKAQMHSRTTHHD
ncbi:hypothetical protein Lal_00020710 [Lupinus albus]|nr:hypothetical protein Lal_00020710 [Lupinus albus]